MFKFDRKRGRNRCNLEFSFFLLSNMWSFQVNLLSKMSPKYLTWLVWGNNWLQSLTGGQMSGRREKVMWICLC